MLVRKVGVNQRLERFSSLTTTVEANEELFSTGSPLQLSPHEQYETYLGLQGPLYITHSSRALAVLLLRLDRLISDASATYQHEIVSVEHVLPQQPPINSEWLKWVPNLSDHQYWVHRLGNLALLSRKKNSSASNYDFWRKKELYFAKGGVCAFALTTQVLQQEVWTAEVIQHRQESLLDVFEAAWRLESRKSRLEVAQGEMAARVDVSNDAIFQLDSVRHGITALARAASGSVIVLKGSQARLDWTGQRDSYQVLREQLVEAGELARTADGKSLAFVRDVSFSSPSAASATILGRADNGRVSWRLKGTSITYAAWDASKGG